MSSCNEKISILTLIIILIVVASVACGLKFFFQSNHVAESKSPGYISKSSDNKSLKPRQIILIRHGEKENYDAICVIAKINDKKAELEVYKEFSVLDNGEISYDGVSNSPIV